MKQYFLFGIGLICLAATAEAQHHHELDPNDRKVAEANGWIYNDLDVGLRVASELGKPLLVVIRCPP